MKTVIRLGFLLTLSVVFFSCSKQNELSTTAVDNSIPSISSKIFPYTNQPIATMLGKSQGGFHSGDVIALYVPYGVYNDVVVSGTLMLKDVAHDQVLGTYQLLPSTDSSAAQLTIPGEIRDVPFMFTTFTIDDSYIGKTVSIYTSIAGSRTASEDFLENGFFIEP